MRYDEYSKNEVFFCACGCRLTLHFRMELKKFPWSIRKAELCKAHKDLHKESQRVKKMQHKLEEMIRQL